MGAATATKPAPKPSPTETAEDVKAREQAQTGSGPTDAQTGATDPALAGDEAAKRVGSYYVFRLADEADDALDHWVRIKHPNRENGTFPARSDKDAIKQAMLLLGLQPDGETTLAAVPRWQPRTPTVKERQPVVAW